MAPSFLTILSTDAILLDANLGESKSDVITALAQRIQDIGRSGDAEQLAHDIQAREDKSATGLPGGIAIPHCRTEAIAFPTIAFARLSHPVDFGANDGPADLIFVLATPVDGLISHTKLLSRLARALVHDEVLAQLRTAEDPTEVFQLLNGPLGNSGPLLPPAPARNNKLKLLAVTGCPTGIAHTYMSAEALEQSVRNNFPNVDLHIETQGAGDNTQLTQRQIDNADVVIFASDVSIKDRERFVNLPSISVGVRQALNSPNTVIQQAVELARLSRGESGLGSENAHRNRPHRSRTAFIKSIPSSFRGKLSGVGQAVMTGVSYMIPFIAAGGLLIALGFLIGGYEVSNVARQVLLHYSLSDLPPHMHYLLGAQGDGTLTTSRCGVPLYIGSVFYSLGQMAMDFIVPVLSGYIAYGLGGRPAIAPGFVGGGVSVLLGAGFLGGIVTGLLGGLVVLLFRLIPVPQWLETLMPVVILPLLGSLIVGSLMIFGLATPLAWAMTGLQNWLSSMNDTSAVLLGVLLGVMICSDLGGPINKSAYLFASAGLAAQSSGAFAVMAASMAAGMVPPLGLALATTLRKQLFTSNEQQNGKAAWLLGFSFVTEGAVPFAAADPLRVLPATILGGATAGGLSMALHVGCRAPHGGIFVIFAMDNPLGFLAAIAAGTLVTAVVVILLKALAHHKREEKSAVQPTSE